ncbi:hypothetical protein DL96DRAFT_1560868 [Flagelloscypha sp. PMI_526]|nr:hypothetical protein DL96DRAFT_1560868 [Flagelloscypha sp. PMI_526]
MFLYRTIHQLLITSPPLITPPIDDAPSIDMIEDNATIVSILDFRLLPLLNTKQTILPLHPDILSTAPCPDTSLTLPDLVATSLNDAIPTRVDSPAPPKSSQRTSPIAQSPAPEALPPPSPPPAPIEESSLNGDTTIEPEVQMNPIPDLFPPEPALESVECAPVPVEDIESRKRKSPPSQPSSPGPSKKLKIDEDIQDHESRGSDDEDCDENMPSEDELTGMIIETLACIKGIEHDYESYLERFEKEWIAFLHEVLQDRSDQEDDSGVFGKVQKNKRVKDPAFPDRRGGEPQWFYIPENDPDRERADLLRAIMPRSSGKRAATKTLKRYYFKPLEPLKSAWEEEGGY